MMSNLDCPFIDLVNITILVSYPPMNKAQSSGRNKFNLFKQKGSPYYTLRVMHAGSRRKFSTGETSIRAAKNKAVAILADIRSRGFDEAVKIHSRRQDAIPGNPTIEQFVTMAREVFKNDLSDPPSRPTYERYLSNLTRVGKAGKAKTLADLTPERIECFMTIYQKNAKKKGRKQDQVRMTMRTIIRNCSSLFSPKMLRAYKKHGLDEIGNPFKEIDLPRIRLIPYTPLSSVLLKEICIASHTLKIGDPDAIAPVRVRGRKLAPDFRKPQLEAYLIFLLELGLGLRRNEADKAQWDWVVPLIDGGQILEVRETPYFRPKSRQSRLIPIPQVIYDELQASRCSDAPFIIPGQTPIDYESGEEPLNIPYRCEESHRTLVTWLRNQGVEDRSPCHRLRKEFGSAVSTTFGLFAAQRMLGHSSPLVTEAHYAGLTQLPALEQAGFYKNLAAVDTADEAASGT